MNHAPDPTPPGDALPPRPVRNPQITPNFREPLNPYASFQSLPALWPDIPGYQVVRLLGEGGSGRVFEVIAPGGIPKAVKVVPVTASSPLSDREVEGLNLVRAIRHPYLIAIDRVDLAADRLTVVMELADCSLRDEYRAHVQRGRPGIPRVQLLGLLRDAAEALDALNNRHRLQHLDIKPENMFLASGHLKIGDFGLMRPAGAFAIDPAANAVTPAYAAPELFNGTVTATSDQYSLAVVYMELLTGHRPYNSSNLRQLAFQHLTRPADVSLLPLLDQAIILKALSRQPMERFASCVELVDALLANPSDEVVRAAVADRVPGDTVSVAEASGATVVVEDGKGDPDRTVPTTPAEPARTGGGERTARTVYLRTHEAPAEVHHLLQRVARQWDAQQRDEGENVVHLTLPRQPDRLREAVGLEDELTVTLRLVARSAAEVGTLLTVTLVRVGKPVPADQFARQTRPLVDSLAVLLHAEEVSAAALRHSERETKQQPLVLVALAGPMRNIPVPCTTLDVSAGGAGLASPLAVDRGEVRIHAKGEKAFVRARVVRCQYDVTARYYRLGLQLAEGQALPLPAAALA